MTQGEMQLVGKATHLMSVVTLSSVLLLPLYDLLDLLRCDCVVWDKHLDCGITN
jgi:hypothetical protein